MEMTYDGALVMPANFVAVDEEEMMYLDGGGIYISNSQLHSALWALCIAYQTAPQMVAAGMAKVCTVISRVVSKFTSWVGSVFGGVAGSFVGWAIGAYCGWELAKATFLAITQNKGIYIGWGFSVR